MKKIIIALLVILIFIGGLTVFAACTTKNVDYAINVVPWQDNTVSYSNQRGEAIYTVSLEGEEIAKIIFSAGVQANAVANSSAPINFIVEVPKKFSTDNLKVLVNGNILNTELVPYMDIDQFFFNAPAPEADVNVTIEGLDGTLKKFDYTLPVREDYPLYLKNGSTFIPIKEESAALLNVLPYIIDFKEFDGERIAVFTFEFGDEAEFYTTESENRLYYSRAGFTDTTPYHSELFEGELPGYTAIDKTNYINEGYAFIELTEGDVYWKITQTVITEITYTVLDD